MNKKYAWLILPIISFIFLNDLILNNKIPLASDMVAHEPIKQWKQTTTEFPHWFPNLFSGMPSYGGYIKNSIVKAQVSKSCSVVVKNVSDWIEATSKNTLYPLSLYGEKLPARESPFTVKFEVLPDALIYVIL